GNRGGERRSNALWGSGGRGGRGRGTVVTTVAFAALFVLPLGAAAPPNGSVSYVEPGLSAKAKKNPAEKVRVIVQSKAGVAGAKAAARGLGSVSRELPSASGIALELPAAAVERLAKVPGLTITPDSQVRMSSLSSDQLWPYAQNFDDLWSKEAVTCATDLLGIQLDPDCKSSDAYEAPAPPAIAIVDSGIEQRLDFGSRVIAEVKLSSSSTESAGDGRGHGTFVAGVAAGAALGFAGAAPNAPLVSVDVIDDAGAAYVSDVIAGIDWILANKDALNIRVANFSLGAPAGSIRTHPLNRAVQKLWLSGVVVVASAGNYAVDGQLGWVQTSPANDPFVITVGAADMGLDVAIGDDTMAPWSVWGYTADGFAKPDMSASGRYMIGPVPVGSTLVAERPGSVVAPGYMRLSGTSFAAPAVAAAAAQVLAHNPHFTPDQVKGALMLSARGMPLVTNRAGGVGRLDAAAAILVSNPPNPNAGLNQFLVADPNGAGQVFDDAAWAEYAAANAAWNQAAWAEAAWAEAAWAEAAWADAAWAEAAWADGAAGE
ncbi:MAG TPA: S8 family serine peptidase, partial [Candidatus Limnocylindria bacterium]|nr:S8 family serine peptidase [Candidatus Limnocylindria bacterium]